MPNRLRCSGYAIDDGGDDNQQRHAEHGVYPELQYASAHLSDELRPPIAFTITIFGLPAPAL
jgi:hypothetical protein